MFRLYDWECSACGNRHESLADMRGGALLDLVEMECPCCGVIADQERLISCPGPYMGEKVSNPVVMGGTYDTVGMRQGPKLPDLPGAIDAAADARKRLAELPDNASKQDRTAALMDVGKHAPTSADYQAHFAKPEYREIAAERKRVQKENKAKRKRYEALKRGENVNFRRDKVSGDPNMTS